MSLGECNSCVWFLLSNCHQTLCLGKKMKLDSSKILEYSQLLNYLVES